MNVGGYFNVVMVAKTQTHTHWEREWKRKRKCQKNAVCFYHTKRILVKCNIGGLYLHTDVFSYKLSISTTQDVTPTI